MKVLVIGYFFPPLGGSGVQRLFKFVKYLPQNNIETVVLTVNPIFVKGPKDKSLLQQLPSDLPIYRTPTFDMNWVFKLFWGFRLPKVVNWIQEHFLIPDKDIFWLPFARRKAVQLVQKEKFDLVFVSGNPFSSFQIAQHLKDRFGIPYILDFRDEWMNNQTRLMQKHNARRNKIEYMMENSAIRNASGLTFISSIMERNFIERYEYINNILHEVITNGYDEEDFKHLREGTRQKEFMRIIYTGSFYDTTKPQPILQVIVDLIRSGDIPKGKIHFEIYGKNTPSFIYSGLDASAEELTFLSLHPYVSHSESLQLQKDADLLLIYIITARNTDAVYNGKSFEYIRSGTPILAICPPHGLAATLVVSTKTGWVYDSADPTEIRKGFLESYRKWEQDYLQINPDWLEIRKYERSAQAGKLSDLMQKVVAGVR
ncbi:MAG TPA: glycosyltransferase [Candidatus Cloacimonadota bacterium]|nr:glycosyltransferase [Candidatus Cloacimonadota bacterium]